MFYQSLKLSSESGGFVIQDSITFYLFVTQRYQTRFIKTYPYIKKKRQNDIFYNNMNIENSLKNSRKLYI